MKPSLGTVFHAAGPVSCISRLKKQYVNGFFNVGWSAETDIAQEQIRAKQGRESIPFNSTVRKELSELNFVPALFCLTLDTLRKQTGLLEEQDFFSALVTHC